jgi:hypothetical protein
MSVAGWLWSREGGWWSLLAWRQGASHGGASVVLKEEKWMGGLSSVWGASESEEGCVCAHEEYREYA